MSDFFNFVDKVEYEGPDSKNPLAFNYYQPEKKIAGRTIAEHLRYSMAYWHSLIENGSNPFGRPTMIRPGEPSIFTAQSWLYLKF